MKKTSFLNKTLGILDSQGVNINHLILVARRLGINVRVYAEHATEAFQYADDVMIGSLTNKNQLKRFASQCQWVIYVNGTGINSRLINYLAQFTELPQGSDELDLINDRSILHVFLDSLQIPSLPYLTVFNTSDVKQALNSMNTPLILRPVQTDFRKSYDVLINRGEDLNQLHSLFTGDAYLLESLPKDARYFDLTLFKDSSNSDVILPVIENHYQDSTLNFANLNPKLPLKIIDQFKMLAQRISNNLNFVGGLTFSFIVTSEHQIYVNGVNLPFNFVNNVYNQTSANVNQILIRKLVGAEIKPLSSIKQVWLIKPIDNNNAEQVQRLWIRNQLSNVNLNALIRSDHQSGYVLMAANSINDVEKKLQESQL